MDLDTGGIYENRLATMMGYPNEMKNERGGINPYPSPTFIEAAKILEERGYARRLVRSKDYSVMGLQHTREGLARSEYLKSRWFYRAVQFKSNVSKRAHDFYGKHKTEIIYAVIFAVIATIMVEGIREIYK